MTMRLLALLLSLVALAGCGRDPDAGHDDHDDHDDGDAHAAGAEFERGPHRGRLLRSGDFALELTIFETGVPPEFHLYAYRDGEPVPPESVTATVELTRLGGSVDRFTFTPQADYLLGSGTVVEPHSFDVAVAARHGGREHRWTYASYEGRTTIPAAIAAASGVKTDVAGPAVIHDVLPLMGQVALNADRRADVHARFAGPVREVRVNQGDAVTAGQTLAIVENRDALRTFAVSAPFAGTVLARHTNVGDEAGDGALFEIADLRTLWVELHAFGDDAARVVPGQAVRIRSIDGELAAESTVARLAPVARGGTQSVVVRAALPNPDGRWRPGLAVAADVTLAAREVPLAVRREGLQRFRDFTVVFAQVGDTYEVRMLELGQQDDTFVEVIGGLEPGTRYVTEQSFLIKADIEKSGASHDH
ncbi:MAG TPA: efflux RND transporter periplasmic adaptor subunit [Xanthomonadales bacterium]|nr:efflux RND transporter periplasmic adaptor subunit [Xanthomonadales bacterium]